MAAVKIMPFATKPPSAEISMYPENIRAVTPDGIPGKFLISSSKKSYCTHAACKIMILNVHGAVVSEVCQFNINSDKTSSIQMLH